MAAFMIPLLKIGGTAALSGLLGKKMGKPSDPSSLTPLPYQAETAGAAKGLQTQGSRMFQFAQPMLESSGKYFGSLLRGSRASMTQAVEPEAAGIRDVYRGAGRAIEAGNLRGAARDMAKAEVSRETAGQIGGLLPRVRPQAAEAVGRLGEFGTQAGASMTTAGGGLYGDLLRGQEQRQQYADMLKQQAGGQAGSLFFNLLKMFPQFFFSKGWGGGDGGGGGGFPGGGIPVPPPSLPAGWAPR